MTAQEYICLSCWHRCEKGVMSSVNVRNCIRFYQTAEELNAATLMNYCGEIIASHWVSTSWHYLYVVKWGTEGILLFTFGCGMDFGAETDALSNHISVLSGLCDFLCFTVLMSRKAFKFTFINCCQFSVGKFLSHEVLFFDRSDLFCLKSLYHLVIYDTVNPQRPWLSIFKVLFMT